MYLFIGLGLLVAFPLAWAVWRGFYDQSPEQANPQARARALDKLISTLDKEVETGRLAPEDALESKRQLEQNLVQSLAASKSLEQSSKIKLIASMLIVVTTIAGFSTLYWSSFGNPNLADLRQADRYDLALSEDASVEARSLMQLAGQRLKQDPTNYTANMQVADAFLQSEQYADAIPYLRQALTAQKADLIASLALGESLFVTEGDKVTDEAASLFENVILANPNSAPANFYLGLYEVANGQSEAAKIRYIELLNRSVEGDVWVPAVKALLAQIESQSGGLPSPINGPTRDDVEAAANMSKSDRDAMIQGMVSGLAERLQNEPDDLAGWLKLARAQMVLNDQTGYIQAARQVSRLDPNNADNNADLARVLLAENGPREPLTDEINALFSRILKSDPDDVEALFFAGLKWFQKGEREQAIAKWNRVLEIVPADHPAHTQMKNEIDKLLNKN